MQRAGLARVIATWPRALPPHAVARPQTAPGGHGALPTCLEVCAAVAHAQRGKLLHKLRGGRLRPLAGVDAQDVGARREVGQREEQLAVKPAPGSKGVAFLGDEVKRAVCVRGAFVGDRAVICGVMGS